MSIKTLSSRIRRLEQKTGSASLSDYYSRLSEEEIEARLLALKLPLHRQAEALAEELGWTVERAQSALDETARLANRHVAGWSDDQIREHLEELCANDAGWRHQIEVWLEDL